MSTLKEIKVAIVGFGLSGSTFHTPFILQVPGLALVAVVSSNREKVISQLPSLQVFNTLDEMLERIKIDLVVITTPNHTHYELVKTCLQHNKHVVIEKPFVLHLSQATELIDLAKQKNLVLCTYQNRRWDGPILTAKKILSDGVLGPIYQCDIHFDRYRPIPKKAKWKEQNIEGAGALYDIGPHLIDHALCFFGFPESIQADIAIQRNNAEVTDYFHILLTYGPTKVILHSSSVILGDIPHIQLQGEKGSYNCYSMEGDEKINFKWQPNDCHTLSLTSNNSVLRLDENGVVSNIALEIEPTTYHQYYDRIYRAIVDGSPPPVSFDDMLQNIQLIELALESSKRGQRIPLLNL